MSDDSARGGAHQRPSVTDPEELRHQAAYWRTNVRYVALLLAVWFVVSYGLGIVFAEALDAFVIPGTGFPVGFWFAQQGSIYVFVALIFVYVALMNRLDRAYGLDEGDDR
jgi:putative solute:sodium symporter small subunit